MILFLLGRYELEGIDPIEFELICRMIQPLSADRITIDGVQSSPVFWQKEKILRFLSEVSDRLEREELGAPIMNYLEQYRVMIGGEDWKLKMSIVLQEDLRRFRTYGNKVKKYPFYMKVVKALFLLDF